MSGAKGRVIIMEKGIRKLYHRVRTMGKSVDASYPAVGVRLRRLAAACGKGDAAAMLELSECLRSTVPEDDGAVNMWLLRAAIYGNTEAQERVLGEIRQTPYFLKKSLIPYENFIPGRRENWHSGGYPGHRLNAAGLLTFQSRENYSLAGINQHRTMLVWQEAGYDPSDEDGFGAETYYNMFYLDEFFQPIPGVPVVENVSTRDIDYLAEPKKRYEAMTHAMAKAAGKRKQVPLWTGFAEI